MTPVDVLQEIVVPVGTIGAAIGALLAAIFASHAAKAAKASNEVNLAASKMDKLKGLIDDRYKAAMYDARMSLREFSDACLAKDFNPVERYEEELLSRKPGQEANRRERPRRLVFTYFRKIRDLKQQGLFTTEEIKKLVNSSDVCSLDGGRPYMCYLRTKFKLASLCGLEVINREVSSSLLPQVDFWGCPQRSCESPEERQ